MSQTVEELREALVAAEKEALALQKEAAAAIPRDHVYGVTWHNKHVFTATCRYSQKTIDAVEEYRRAFPKANNPLWGLDHVNSMQYALLEDHLVSVSGGSCVLRDRPKGPRGRYVEPRPLTKFEVALLRLGEVPESLKGWGVSDD